MDAVKFIEERNRMCKSFSWNCDDCPADKNICCDPFEWRKELATIVEEWSAAHPRKTRQSVFLEQWPETRIDIYGVLCVCPDLLTSAYRGAKDGCATPTKRCADCRREFWGQEVE